MTPPPSSGATIRTVWRDLDALQKAGFPLFTERAADGNRGVWRVTEDFKRSLPLKLTLGELAALLMSRHLVPALFATNTVSMTTNPSFKGAVL
jgi:predicted DNA-binding transcriptional regulator YafY